MTRKQRIVFLTDYVAGKNQPKEIDYANFSDDELRWVVTIQNKVKNNDLSGDEYKELNRLEQKIKWK